MGSKDKLQKRNSKKRKQLKFPTKSWLSGKKLNLWMLCKQENVQAKGWLLGKRLNLLELSAIM